MANDAHLRLAADFLGQLAEMSGKGYFAGAAGSPCRVWLEPSGEELYMYVLDGEENKTSFTMTYNREAEAWEVGGGW